MCGARVGGKDEGSGFSCTYVYMVGVPVEEREREKSKNPCPKAGWRTYSSRLAENPLRLQPLLPMQLLQKLRGLPPHVRLLPHQLRAACYLQQQ